MIKRAVAAGFTALVMLVGTIAAPASAATGVVHGVGHPDAIEGSFVVMYKNSHGLDLAARSSIKTDHTFGSAVRGFAARMDLAKAKRLAANPEVAIVEQDRIVRLNAVPGALAQLPAGVMAPRGPAIPVPPMGRGVKAYVLDTGIRISHSSFNIRPIWGTNTIGGSNADCNGHGTHVAGILGGSFNERWSSFNAQLVAVKVLDCNGSGSLASVIAGINWVTANRTGPSIANMSLGTLASPTVDQALRNSIGSGITYIVAAGNANGNTCQFSPARVAEAITVGAVYGNSRRAWFSNYGTCVDLFAHGVGVRSAWHTSDTATKSISGTSMSAPHVAAMAANYLSTNLTATPAQVHAWIVNGATTGQVIDPGPGSPNRVRWGHLNPFPNPPTSPSIDCDSWGGQIFCHAWAGGGATEYAWFIDGGYVGSSETLGVGCALGYNHAIRVIAANAGGMAESGTTHVRCSDNPPV